jgi:carboxymethylenebutenolidase
MESVKEDVDGVLAEKSSNAKLEERIGLKSALGVGFAAAVAPVAAQTTIKTDTSGLIAGEIGITVKGQPFSVYRAQPEGKSNLPVVVVVSEIFGIHEHIADVVRRFGKQGYLALAPDLFVRQGDATAYESVPEVIKEVISKVPDQQVMEDLDACVAWAKDNGGNIDKLGVTGFCWGGRITWLYSSHSPQIKAGVAWYGKLVGNQTALTPHHPVDIAPNLKVPVLGLYGAKDAGIPLDTVEQMKAALAQGESHSEIIVYPDSGHAFYADYRPSYVEADAEDGWIRCLEWFRAHGVA